jgi:hypothetical protein
VVVGALASLAGRVESEGGGMACEPWHIHFFQRHRDDDPTSAVPARDFLNGLPPKVRAEFLAVLSAVAAAPPPAFVGGGKWEVMHGNMAGYYEVRVQGGGQNHRLFCLLERHADDLGGPSIVCLGGLSKRRRTAAHPRDYAVIRRYGIEFRKRWTVAD